MTAKTKLKINVKDLPVIRATPQSQDGKPHVVEARMAYGADTGLMIASRDQGYHSRPHIHDSEQFNYIMEGEIWFFIGEHGFRCRKGDIVRVPRNAVHWTFVRAKEGCTMLETHTPSLTGDPDLKGGFLMVDDDEDAKLTPGVTNIFVECPQAAEMERRAFAADPD